MKVTEQYLEKINACGSGVRWFCAQTETDSVNIIKKLIKENHTDWANWFICHLFNKKQKVLYAIYAAESVLKRFEKKHPNDKRARQAIEAAGNYLKSPCKKTKTAAGAAYAAASAAADAAAYAASAAADAAARKKLRLKILKYGLTLLEVRS